MTTYKGFQLKTGEILSIKYNIDSPPKYFLDEKEISLVDYWYLYQNGTVEKNIEIVKESQKTYWTLLKRLFGLK